jgi:3-oxoacyl-[acyl-carrier-protein] synthase II
MELKRVVVTGFGAITPIGNNAKEYWENLVKGESGAAPITLFDATNFKTKFACEVKISIHYSISIRKRLKKWTEILNWTCCC